MSSRNLPRVGVIGAGGFGLRHARILANLAAEGWCQLVAACDPQIDSLPAAWSENPLREVRLFRSHEEMIRDGALDYIVIASPPHWHEEHCLHALEAGAFVYLEKPPVPTFSQLCNLLEHPAADRVAVGFQMLEATAIRSLKQRLVDGSLGEIREIWASGLWPRPMSYYKRASWAGKMMLGDRAVFDGPLTNALAHLVQNVFFLAGDEMDGCATPRTTSGCFARAQPIESYDFGGLKGTMENGIRYHIVAGHCSRLAVPWKVSVRTDRGIYSVAEKDLPSVDLLLAESHRAYLTGLHEDRRIPCPLSDCLGYSMATSAAWLSSAGIDDIPRGEILLDGTAADAVCHVESIYKQIEKRQSDGLSFSNPDWMRWGPEVSCRETLSLPATVIPSDPAPDALGRAEP